MVMEHSIKPNGFKPRSWGDIGVIATILAMLLSCVAWGLKLEWDGEVRAAEHRQQIKALDDELDALKLIIARGILPRADERIKAIERTDTALLERIERLENQR